MVELRRGANHLPVKGVRFRALQSAVSINANFHISNYAADASQLVNRAFNSGSDLWVEVLEKERPRNSDTPPFAFRVQALDVVPVRSGEGIEHDCGILDGARNRS